MQRRPGGERLLLLFGVFDVFRDHIRQLGLVPVWSYYIIVPGSMAFYSILPYCLWWVVVELSRNACAVPSPAR